jgi:hypothetical protein
MVWGTKARKSYAMNSDAAATREQVMGTCLRLELEASALYRRFQAEAPDAELSDLWETMARAELHHAHVIGQLASWRGFKVPAISWEALAAVVERIEAIRREGEAPDLGPDRMLSITAALEFSEMDDLFGAICQAGGIDPDAGRADHLAPLLNVVLARRSGDGVLRHLLAALIRLRRRGETVNALRPPGDVPAAAHEP